MASEEISMFDEKVAFGIADGMRRAGKRPSIRTVRKALAETGNSGSFRRVTEVLEDWRKKHGLSEFEADTGVPPEFQTRIDAITAALWDAAQSKAQSALHAERERSSALAKRLGEAEEMARQLVAENERLRERVSDLDHKQDRRSREFWDRVVIGIAEMLKGVDPMSSAEIFGRLPAEVRREWLSHPEPLGVPTLTKKLKERSGRDRYVVKVRDKWRSRAAGDGDEPAEAKASKATKRPRNAAA